MEACAQKFYASSSVLRGFNIERFCHASRCLLNEGIGVIFLFLEDDQIRGAIGGISSVDLCSGERYSQEWFWFIEPEFRGAGMKLYREFERWTREQDCAQIRMIHLADSMPERLERVYKYLGFRLLESHYGKDLLK